MRSLGASGATAKRMRNEECARGERHQRRKEGRIVLLDTMGEKLPNSSSNSDYSQKIGYRYVAFYYTHTLASFLKPIQ